MIGSKKPTAAEMAHMAACRAGPCIPCIVRYRAGHIPADYVFVGATYDHKKSGNIRRGHMFGFCSCAWHHLGHARPGWSAKETGLVYGPSLTDGSRFFRSVFGTDDELIDLQRRILEGEPWGG